MITEAHFPNGISTHGVPAFGSLANGVELAPGAKVFHVCNRSGLPSGDGRKPTYPFATVNAALAKCQSGRNDQLWIGPGHTENISAADMWSAIVAGVKIIGFGTGNDRPTFTFSATAGQVIIDVANVLIRNCRFKAAGPSGTTALTITAPFSVTAAGFSFVANEVEVGVDADQLCTNFMSLAAGADDCKIVANDIYGAAAAEITTVVTTAGAVDRLKIIGNRIGCGIATAATGVLLDLDNAALLDNDIISNILWNKTASSKFVIDPHATSTGLVHNNIWVVGDGATAPADAGFATYTTTYNFGINQCVTAAAVSALLSPVVDA